MKLVMQPFWTICNSLDGIRIDTGDGDIAIPAGELQRLVADAIVLGALSPSAVSAEIGVFSSRANGVVR